MLLLLLRLRLLHGLCELGDVGGNALQHVVFCLFAHWWKLLLSEVRHFRMGLVFHGGSIVIPVDVLWVGFLVMPVLLLSCVGILLFGR